MQTTSQQRIAAKEIAEVTARIAEMQKLLDEMKADYERRFGKPYAEPRRQKPARPSTHIMYVQSGIGGFNDVVVKCPKCGKETTIYAVSSSDMKKYFQRGMNKVFDYMTNKANQVALETGVCKDCQGK